MDTTWATLDTPGDKPVLRFERRFGHRPERVWKLITEPEELAHWFPGKVAYDAGLTAGSRIRFHFGDDDIPDDMEITEVDSDGVIIEVDPPKVFGFSWQDDVLRFELVPDGDGCRLLFSQTLSDTTGGLLSAVRNAAGWDTCLAGLRARLEGHEFTPPDPFARMEAYAERFELGDGQVETTGDGYLVRFERDLVWRDADTIRAALPAVDPGTDWQITTDPSRGHRAALTRAVPAADADQLPAILAECHARMELLFAEVVGDQRRPWPDERVAQLEKRYADRLG